MKTESGTQPSPFRITTIGDEAIIEFAENVEERLFEKAIIFVYDSYFLKTRVTPTLQARIDKDYSAWLAKAKGIEATPVKVDPVQEKIVLLEARLAKVEAVPIIKTALEPVIINDTISK